MEISDKILQFKKIVEDNKLQKAQLEGKLENLMETLKTEFGIDSIQQAKDELKELEIDIQKKGTELESELNELQREFGKEGLL